MCFSAEASIIAYIVGTTASLYLLTGKDKYDRHIGLFSIVFIQIQLAEFLMWLDQDCNMINHYASIYAQYILVIQQFAITLGAILFKTTIIPMKLLYILLAINIYSLTTSLYDIIINKRILCSKSINNGFLEWDIVYKYKNVHYVLYFSYIFLIWPFFKSKKGWITFIFLFVTLLFGINHNNEFVFEQWESKWCYIGVLLPILIIFYNKIQSIN